MNLLFGDRGWEDLSYWIDTDRKVAKRVLKLIEDCRRDPFDGLGKPESLRDNLSAYWSRRITEEHRLVYRIAGDELWIVQARYHYEK